MRRISEAKRKIFTMKTIVAFSEDLEMLVYALTSMGSQITTLHEGVNFIAVVTAGPIA